MKEINCPNSSANSQSQVVLPESLSSYLPLDFISYFQEQWRLSSDPATTAWPSPPFPQLHFFFSASTASPTPVDVQKLSTNYNHLPLCTLRSPFISFTYHKIRRNRATERLHCQYWRRRWQRRIGWHCHWCRCWSKGGDES